MLRTHTASDEAQQNKSWTVDKMMQLVTDKLKNSLLQLCNCTRHSHIEHLTVMRSRLLLMRYTATHAYFRNLALQRIPAIISRATIEPTISKILLFAQLNG